MPDEYIEFELKRGPNSQEYTQKGAWELRPGDRLILKRTPIVNGRPSGPTTEDIIRPKGAPEAPEQLGPTGDNVR
jgi:hypothetical protein